MVEYTAISFAPVQGFIEKSRKLRDLYGASLILSYLSFKIIEAAKARLGEDCVISPGCPNIQEGMPNRILIKGKFDRRAVQDTLLKEWQQVLEICRKWIEDNLGIPQDDYYWSQTEDQKGKEKAAWERWGSYTWEVFWGHGASVPDAMEDLETRKLKRDWTGINWMGESSSLTGTDAIAWHQLGKPDHYPGRSLTDEEQKELKRFYHRLTWILDDPYTRHQQARTSLPSDAELGNYVEQDTSGKFIAGNERLSIPELVKRLVTLPYLAKKIGMTNLDEGFKDINRDAGYWTGWFMGDGDKVGDKLQTLAEQSQEETSLKTFSNSMRGWGEEFKDKSNLFPQGKGRVIYAGGDDFLGVLYSEQDQQNTPEKVKPLEAFRWLLELPQQWETLQQQLQNNLDLQFTFSVGFVWAGHQVPQRDILQHCREAETLAKRLGRDRVTLRVVFNSGQYVQWTCPWDYLYILTKYRDRDGQTGTEANWSHIYSDWAQLKARHAIASQENSQNNDEEELALAIFDIYFQNRSTLEKKFKTIFPNNTDTSDNIIQWIDGLINVGWQLCSDT